MGIKKKAVLFLSGLAVLYLSLSPAVAQAQNLYVTGGVRHEAIQTGMPAHADTRFFPDMEEPGFPSKISYRTGLTYDNGSGSGIFLDLDRSYRGAPDAALILREAEPGTRLRNGGTAIDLGFFLRAIGRAQFFYSFSYSSLNGIDDGGEVKTVDRGGASFGVLFPLNFRTSFIVAGNVISAISPGPQNTPLDFVSNRLTFDAVCSISRPLGLGFSATFGVTNLLDRRDDDPLRDANGLHYNPGRNVFVSFKHRF